MAKNSNEHYPEINVYITIKSIGLAALVGLGGYSLYPGDSHGKEISGLDKQYIVKLESRLDVLEARLTLVSREISIVSAMLSKSNRKMIEERVIP